MCDTFYVNKVSCLSPHELEALKIRECKQTGCFWELRSENLIIKADIDGDFWVDVLNILGTKQNK